MNGIFLVDAPDKYPISARQFQGTLAALQMILLLAAIDQTVITTAMPRIIRELGGLDRYAFATTSYLFTSTLAVPIFGKLSDIFGRRLLLLIGLGIFLLGSLFCTIAGLVHLPGLDAMNQLVAARFIQGIGGGAIIGLSFAIIADLVSAAKRGKYQGHFAAVFALAAVAGPPLGGYVTDCWSWRILFLLNIPVGILGGFMFANSFKQIRKQPDSTVPDSIIIDWLGIILFSASMACLLISLSDLQHFNFSLRSMLPLSLSIGLLTIFVLVEKKAKEPFMPLAVFKQGVFIISFISLAVTGMGMFGGALIVPLFLQSALGLNMAQCGGVLSPLILAVAGASIIAGHLLSNRRTYKMLLLTAFCFLTIGTGLLAMSCFSSCLPLLVGEMLVCALGLGLILPVYTIVIQNAAHDELLGVVTGFSQFFRSIGGTLGTAAMGAILFIFYNQELSSHVPLNLERHKSALLLNILSPNSLQIQLEHAGLPYRLADNLVMLAKGALLTAVSKVYIIYTIILFSTLLANLFIEEIPLQEKESIS